MTGRRNYPTLLTKCEPGIIAATVLTYKNQSILFAHDYFIYQSACPYRILKRYSRMNVTQQQQSQLVNFLPTPPSQESDSETTQQSFSTFKPPSYSPTSFDSHTIDKELNQNQWKDVRPPSYSQIEREKDSYSQIERQKETITLSDPWERRPIVRRESVWLEDELFEMTRRPQDELTTEL